jgi:hypothetical protein
MVCEGKEWDILVGQKGKELGNHNEQIFNNSIIS